MNEPTIIGDVTSLHRYFCEETGVSLRLGLGEYNRERAWIAYIQAGFTFNDLRLVLTYLKGQIKLGERRVGALKFSNLLERLDSFEEELGLAKAHQKNRKPPITHRERAVALLRPNVVPMAPSGISARPVADYIAELRKAAQ